ncbi:MAG TPA: metallophosphoesterase [Acidimicrobiia bacterium]|nr:metallophosphoesterase [Acidimicrobiia bacterium]
MPRRWTVVAAALVVASALTVVSNTAHPARADTTDPVLYTAGDVAQCDGAGDEATAALIQPALAANANASVAMLGDGAYPTGDLQWYQSCYGSAASWGQFKARTYPATGNHDYEPPAPADAGGYFNYFSDAAAPVTAPGAPPGVYSYDLGVWHVIVLNSTCGSLGGSGVGGCNAKSPMAAWLRQDLAQTQAKCMIAVWHHPRFYSASKLPNLTPTAADVASHDNKLNDIWDILQKGGVDIALSGHHHVYERMAKLDARPDGAPGPGVPDPVNGMRQFVVGTGGGPYEQFIAGQTDPNSEKQIEKNWGVLKLDLHSTTYDWQFLSAGAPGERPAGDVLDSGNDTCRSDGPATTATTATTAAPGPAVTPTTPNPHTNSSRSGYWMVGADGRVFGFGEAHSFGDATHLAPGAEAVDLEPTPSGNGYWIVDSGGKVQAFGDAALKGMPDSSALTTGERVTSLSATPNGAGYWLFTDKGRVLTYGDAVGYGDMAKVKLNGPVLDSIPTPSGKGYYMVASDGGIFAFGDAAFYGSMGGRKLNAAVQSLVPDADGRGYWLVAADGGIFAFDATFKGSMGGSRLAKPVTGMVRYADGYLMVGEDGGIFDFSSSPFLGSLGASPPARPIVSVAPLGG